MDITWQTTGFLNNAEYSFYLMKVTEPYKDMFPGCDTLSLYLYEEPAGVLPGGRGSKTFISISEDRKTIKIRIPFEKLVTPKGKIVVAEPNEVFSALRNTIERAKEEYTSSNL